MSTFIFVLVCLLSLSTPVLSQCPNNWIRNEGSCYHFSHDLENWPDSMVICNAVKAFLVEINSENENDFILNNANASSYWIGLSDLAEEGTWKWMHSQTDPTFTKWAATEPNNAGQNENCAMIRKKEKDWNDYVCQNGMHYICEKHLEDIEAVG